ncbi:MULTISPECIES: hypothetical protein [Rhodopirellula]|uniref:hypothetical protein n=1 Tax=Rhodopirellula TaxID=265488 RepID=UPI00257AEA41|nr:hypothetical protein [Rhodopirellula sp. UBA1907]|tara:strand:+ start:150 stop:764 length:615 start_codon:yes stop_codon:yes gene_type:complete
MAKKESKGRIRVFFAEIEGDDETIQDGLRALTGAVSKTFQPKVVMLPSPSSDGETPAIESVDDLIDDPDFEEDVVDAPAKKRPSNGKKKPPKLSLVSELDLRPEGKTNFRDFFEGKAPRTQKEQIAVIIYYLKCIAEEQDITADHVYTCLKNAEVKVPTFLPQVIRKCSSEKGWVDSSNSKDLNITTSGENFVEHEMQRAPEAN